MAVAQGAVDVEELEDAVPPHVLRVPPRLLPAQRRALRQQPHAGWQGEREAGRGGERNRAGAPVRGALDAAGALGAAAAGPSPART